MKPKREKINRIALQLAEQQDKLINHPLILICDSLYRS